MRFSIIEGEVYYLPAEEAALRSAMYQLGIDSTWIYTATELGGGDELLDGQLTGVFYA